MSQGNVKLRKNTQKLDSETNEKILQNDDEYKYVYENPKLSTSLYYYSLALIIFASVLAAVYYSAYLTILPQPVSNSAPLIVFSEERAKVHAEYLSTKIGKRVVGSKDNDRLAAEYIVNQVRILQQKAEKLRQEGRPNVPYIDFDVQKVSGGHIFDILGKVVTNIYTNITNVVVRISPGTDASKEHAVLVNSHFDSSLATQGAADAAVPIGIMIETLSNLVHSPSLPNAVIFLFNGAEESLQQGSHAFVTKHPWAKSCRVVVNLEACGSGGPELLFQVGNIEILQAFAKAAPFPHGSSFGNDIFSTGIIQSDTDYRIFRDYGNIIGLDLAYYRESYVYHTNIDNMERVGNGSVQHMGQNTLAVVKEFASNNEFLHKQHKKSKVIYYDFMGGTFMAYSVEFATYAHGIVFVIFVVAALLTKMFKRAQDKGNFTPVLRATFSTFVSFLAGILASVVVGLFTSKVMMRPLSYFSSPPLTMLLYGLPALTAILWVQSYFTNTKTKRYSKTDYEWHSFVGLILFYVLFLGIATACKLGVSYIFAWKSALGLVGLLINYFFFNRARGFSYLIAFPFPIYLAVTLIVGVIDVFVPLVGRLGYIAWSDVILGLISGLLYTITLLPSIPVAHRAGNIRGMAKIFTLLSLISVLSVALFHHPFTPERPKRIFLQHTHFVSSPTFDASNIEPFILVSSPDPYPMHQVLKHSNLHYTSSPDSETPYIWDTIYPFSFMLLGSSVRVPAKPYPNVKPINLTVTSDSYDATTDLRTITINFYYEKSEWSTIRIDDDIVDWSFPYPVPLYRDGAILLRHVGDHGITDWQFTLVFRSNKKIKLWVSGNDFILTDPLLDVMAELPSWTTSSALVGIYSLYEI